MDEGGVDVDEAGVVVVLEDLLHMTSGTGNPMLMNTGEKDVVASMREGNSMGVDHLFVVIDSTEEGGDAGDVDKTTTMATDDPLLIMVLTHFPRRTPPIRPPLSL